MNGKRKQHYLYINGEEIPVTQEVYKTFWYYTNKEEYFMRHLKVKHKEWEQNGASREYIPAREYSLDQFLVYRDHASLIWDEFENVVLSAVWLDSLLDELTDEERKIVLEFYINGKTERETCAVLGIPRTTFQRREKKLRKKLGILLNNFL